MENTHQEKQEIFDRYAAQFEEFGNFEGMIDAVLSTAIHKEELIFRIFECCDLVQEEQQKRIAEKLQLGWVKCEDCTCRSDQSEFRCPENTGIDKSSIINTINIIS